MERSLYIVVGSPLSDIGKGWLAGSIANKLNSAHLIKVDPLLNSVDLAECDLTQGLGKMTDAETYNQLGISFNSSQLFLQGNILLEFLEQNKSSSVSTHTTPRLTFSDVAEHFARKIQENFTASGKNDLVVEVGGAVIDSELVYIPSIFNLIANKLGIAKKIILLSYLDYSEDPNLAESIKTRHITYGIEHTRRVYGEPHLVFFRRRNLPETIENNLDSHIDTISKRAVFAKERLLYLPNFGSPAEEGEYIKSIGEKF
jgi:CTP synthase (UTP-ammonia lyase)